MSIEDQDMILKDLSLLIADHAKKAAVKARGQKTAKK